MIQIDRQVEQLRGLFMEMGLVDEWQSRDMSPRAASQMQILAWIAPIARGLGVTRIADVTGLDEIGIPVMAAVRPLSRGLAVSQGKGLTPDHAKISAIMESLEGWHAERHYLPLQAARIRDLPGELRVDAGTLVRHEPDDDVLAALELEWTLGLDLISGQPCFVPYGAIDFDNRVARAFDPFVGGTNGLGAGCSRLEAAAHGLREVIEREAVCAARDLGDEELAMRRIDLDSVRDPGCRWLLERFRAANLEVVAWDITSRIPVPTVDCLVLEAESRWFRPLPQTAGAASDARPVVALRRAMLEAAQARVTVIAGARDDLLDDRYAFHFDEAQRSADRQLLDDPTPVVLDEDVQTQESSVEQLRVLTNGVHGAGFERCVVVDLTRPDIGVPVTKVVVPGCRWDHEAY